MKFSKNFYVSFASLNSSKPELSKWYVFAGDRGVFVILSKEFKEENIFKRRFKLNNYAH